MKPWPPNLSESRLIKLRSMISYYLNIEHDSDKRLDILAKKLSSCGYARLLWNQSLQAGYNGQLVCFDFEN